MIEQSQETVCVLESLGVIHMCVSVKRVCDSPVKPVWYDKGNGS